MDIKEARSRVKELIDRMQASAANLHREMPDVSREREKDAEALKMLTGGGPATEEGCCPSCGV
jgi:hypothetical protein